MKYKKHIATGALAFSLLVGGTAVFAATPQDLGIKDTQPTFQKQHKAGKIEKVNKNEKGIKSVKDNNIVGVISAVDTSGFTVDIKNIKTKIVTSVEVKTDTSTVYTKDGAVAVPSDLIVGQKVIISGDLDKTTNIMTAKNVKMVTKKVEVVHVAKKVNKKLDTKVIGTKTDAKATVNAVQ